MFKKDIPPSNRSKVKSSVQRGLRQKLLETYPGLEPYIEDVMPKKASLEAVKLPDRVTLYTIDSTPLFFQPIDGPPVPHLRLIHAYPSAVPTIQIDRGAIRFVLSGATLMAPGLTSPGGRLPDAEHALEAGQIVGVKAEGKEEICMIGMLKVGTEEIKREVFDALWDAREILSFKYALPLFIDVSFNFNVYRTMASKDRKYRLWYVPHDMSFRQRRRRFWDRFGEYQVVRANYNVKNDWKVEEPEKEPEEHGELKKQKKRKSEQAGEHRAKKMRTGEEEIERPDEQESREKPEERKIGNKELEEKLRRKLEQKLKRKLGTKIEEKLRRKLEQKLERKLGVKLEEKLEEKLERKLKKKLEKRLEKQKQREAQGEAS
ncbi:translation machinery-associated protein 20 [Penicillium rubens]|nr:translation machinery-associated protein 20 [Penicillium rubens]